MAGDRQPQQPRDYQPGFGLPRSPARARAGVEQDRDDRKIEPGARALRRVGARRNRFGAIDAAGRKMPPAAVKWHIEIGVAPPRHSNNALDRLIESVEMQPEMPCLAA